MAAVSRSLSKVLVHNTAFFCCDIQERFRPVISHFPSVIHVGKTLVKSAAVLDVPLFVTEQYPKALGNTVPELAEELKNVRRIHKYDKMLFSMLTPELEADLVKYDQVKNAVIFGIEAHVCVLQTTKDLIEKGYNVHIVADGTSSQRPGDRKIAFENLKQSGAILTTSESILFQILKDAKHPRFKDISNLCKGERPDSGLVVLSSNM